MLHISHSAQRQHETRLPISQSGQKGCSKAHCTALEGGRAGRWPFLPQRPTPASIPSCGRCCFLRCCKASSSGLPSAVLYFRQQHLFLLRSLPQHLRICFHLCAEPGSALVHVPSGSFESWRIVRRSLPGTADRGLTLLHFPIARHCQVVSEHRRSRGMPFL